MRYACPSTPGAIASFKPRYSNSIGNEFVSPVKGQYFTSTTPVTDEVIGELPRSTTEGIDHALDAVHAAADVRDRTSVQDRSLILLKTADHTEQNLELLAVAGTQDSGKSVCETLDTNIPLTIDHFRYFAGCIHAQESSAVEISEHTVVYRIYEPLDVVGQTIPWNFPLLTAVWKLVPALATGNCTVLKSAEQTPPDIRALMELVDDPLPAGVLNVMRGYDKETGEALATSRRITKITFADSTPADSHIMECATENIIPSTVEPGGRSPDIYFKDIMQAGPSFTEGATEGLVLGFSNQDEVCTCPLRTLVQESIYSHFMDAVLAKVVAIKHGNPLDTGTMVGAQASKRQPYKIRSYLEVAQEEGTECLVGGDAEVLPGNLSEGYYIKPTLLKGGSSIRVFQEEIFSPVIVMAIFKDETQALQTVNDTDLGLGIGLWTRGINHAYRVSRAIKAGHMQTNCYHLCPAHATFGDYKKSGAGREAHKMIFDHYQQTKNLSVSYDIKPLDFF